MTANARLASLLQPHSQPHVTPPDAPQPSLHHTTPPQEEKPRKSQIEAQDTPASELRPGQKNPATGKRVPPTNSQRTNYLLGASLLAAGASWDDAAHQAGAKNGKSLKSGLQRKGITRRKMEVVATQAAANGETTLSNTVAKGGSLKSLIRDQVQQMLANLPGERIPLADEGKGKVTVLQQLTDITAKVEGWDSQRASSLIQVGVSVCLDSQPAEGEPIPV